ncbi:MAG: glycosyltransferase family 87 protein, partial [Pirellulaceae bacterium]
ALLMAPLSCCPYPLAYAAFFAASCAAWLVTLDWLGRKLELLPARAWWWALAGWPVACETLIGGQASMAAAWIVVATLWLLKRNCPVAAGTVLACAAYKPNVLALFGLGVAIRYPRVLWGLAGMAGALITATVVLGGSEALREYCQLAARLSGETWEVETPAWKVHSLTSWVACAVPGHARLLTLVLGMLVCAAVGIAWRRRVAGEQTDDLAAGGLLVLNALFNPYTPIYDLVLLGPAAMLLARGAGPYVAVRSDSPGWAGAVAHGAFAGLFFGPHLSQALAQRFSIQLFPLVLLGAAVCLTCPLVYRSTRTSVCGIGGALSR